MKLVKIVKYQRVRYGDLEEGDRYTTHVHSGRLMDEHICDCSWGFKDALYRPLDTDKYPPESVTHNLEGITADEWEWMRVRQHGGRTVLIDFDESEIETRYI